MFHFLLVVHALVALALVGVILMQRSEGGGLASGGSPSGLMSARGAADFLTRTTTILASVFVLLSIALAGVASINRAPATLDTSLARPAAPLPQGAPATGLPPVPGATGDAAPQPVQQTPSAAIPLGAEPAPQTARPAAQPRSEAPRERPAPPAPKNDAVVPPPVVTTTATPPADAAAPQQ